MTHTYRLKKIPTDPKIPIWLYPEGESRTDVMTPIAYLEYKVEEEMVRLDRLMVRYIDGYLKKRRELRQKFQNLIDEYRGVSRFRIIHGFTPEEQREFQRLVKESLERAKKRMGRHGT